MDHVGARAHAAGEKKRSGPGRSRSTRKTPHSSAEGLVDALGNRGAARFLASAAGRTSGAATGRTGSSNPGASPARGPVATTRDGETTLTPSALSRPDKDHILAHEQAHRQQSGASAPLGSRQQLETDAEVGARRILSGAQHTPQYAAPRGMTLAYDPADWLPRLDQQSQAEASSLNAQGLTDPRNTVELSENTEQGPGRASANYTANVAASGPQGFILSSTSVRLDYDAHRTVSVVGPPTVRINSELGSGPVTERPAMPYTLSYSRTITYTDADGRSATAEISGQVFLSQETVAAQIGATPNPSFEALLNLQGDSGYVTASVDGQTRITSVFANYAATGTSLRAEASGAVMSLGRSGGFSLVNVSAEASFLDPTAPAGSQFASLREYLVEADIDELARRLSQGPPGDKPGMLDDAASVVGGALGTVLAAVIDGVEAVLKGVADLWDELPDSAKGILTALGKFAAGLAVIAGIAALIVFGSEGAIAFGAAMLIVGLGALVVGFVGSVGRRLSEAWHSDDRWSLVAAPFVALLDALGISGIIEAGTDRSVLTDAPLNRTGEERWEAGTTGVLQLVGIFLMARGAGGGGGGEAPGDVVSPTVRGNMADFHALPEERLPVLPEGHAWVRRGGEWTLLRDPTAPSVPLEISIYSDGAGRINYNVRSGDLVLQSDAMTRPTNDTFPSGAENRLPPQLRGTGDQNPYRDPNSGLLFDKGHGVDYADRLEGGGARSSNADPANFTPQARYWNQFLRNQLVAAIRARGGGYREMPVYDAVPARTVDGTPIPSAFVFVETSPTGEPLGVWRVPNDPTINTRQMSQLPQYSRNLSDVPTPVIAADGTAQPPGTIIAPGVILGGERGRDERTQ